MKKTRSEFGRQQHEAVSCTLSSIHFSLRSVSLFLYLKNVERRSAEENKEG